VFLLIVLNHVVHRLFSLTRGFFVGFSIELMGGPSKERFLDDPIGVAHHFLNGAFVSLLPVMPLLPLSGGSFKEYDHEGFGGRRVQIDRSYEKVARA
jgi:hypothetical protein